MRRREDGYAMAALLVAMAVMTVMMGAAMPVWKTMAQREKEAELIFRGQQYARAIGLYQRKLGPGTLPPNLDILIDQRFLRKKYKDPITNDDFQLLSAGQTAVRPGQQVGEAQPQQPLSQAAGRLGAGRLGQAGPVIGGITGVASKSTATSLRLYNNRDKYNEWTFVFVQSAQGPGSQTPGGQGAGGRGRGARGGQPPARPGAGAIPPGSGGPILGPRGGRPPQLPVDRRVF
jgi:type II secretory pathway pseudopilin PulG